MAFIFAAQEYIYEKIISDCPGTDGNYNCFFTNSKREKKQRDT